MLTNLTKKNINKISLVNEKYWISKKKFRYICACMCVNLFFIQNKFKIFILQVKFIIKSIF